MVFYTTEQRNRLAFTHTTLSSFEGPKHKEVRLQAAERFYDFWKPHQKLQVAIEPETR